ncbi:MAG: trypsin-like peptidase domain-containing protein [Clostridia bacterium]|nr:trypsin-like peptidase domain-containing protein [Clostridia bacterium]
MDDLFNNPQNTPVTPQQPTADAPQQPAPQQPTPIANAPQQPTQQQPVAPTAIPGQPYYTGYRPAPAPTYNPTYPPQTTPTYTPSQPNTQSSATQTPQQPPMATSQTPQVKKTKKKVSVGMLVFIALLCVSIVIGSIAIGTTLGDEPLAGAGTSTENIPIDGADAKVEDSPISFSEYSGNGTMSSEQVYQAVKEVNVGVLVYSHNQMISEGSGIIVGEDADKKYTYIVTAAHVIAESNVNLQVQFSDESDIEAEIVGLDAKTDIGVIRVKKTDLKAATFGNSDKLAVGQTVYAIGNPGGTEFFGSFTSGMISAIDRPVPTTNSSYDLPCIQHNAAINPGNSGGALVNEYGQVIGLNSSKISSTEYEGMGFAVPSKTLLDVYNKILKDGYVSGRPKLGITYFTVTSDYSYSTIALKNKLPYGSIVIVSISPDSDVVNTSIKEGDIVTAVNGKELESTDALLEAIENAKVGDTLNLTVCRINKNTGDIATTFQAKVKLVEDKGNTTVATPQETTEPQSPFNYFEDFDD